MLYIHFGSMENEIRYAKGYFDLNYKPEWLLDEYNKKMILDVDRSTVIDKNIIESPILGTIPPQWLSGGVKALICMNSDDSGAIFNATNCGDNCSKWIIDMSRKKDLTITLYHFMDFSYELGRDVNLNAVILNTGKKVNTMEEYGDQYVEFISKIYEKSSKR